MLACSGVAAAQGTDWQRGTALSVFGGAASAGSHVGGAGGATIGWELLPYFTVEGSGTWLADRGGANGFAGLIGTRVGLAPRGTLVPFVSAGVGVYRASIDARRDDLPAFYGRRLGAGPGALSERVFDDFLVALGGGADVYVTRHLAIRPDVRVLLARADGDTRPVTVVAVHLAYHFEDHPITP
jgi:hypothetical protein